MITAARASLTHARTHAIMQYTTLAASALVVLAAAAATTVSASPVATATSVDATSHHHHELVRRQGGAVAFGVTDAVVVGGLVTGAVSIHKSHKVRAAVKALIERVNEIDSRVDLLESTGVNPSAKAAKATTRRRQRLNKRFIPMIVAGVGLHKSIKDSQKLLRPLAKEITKLRERVDALLAQAGLVKLERRFISLGLGGLAAYRGHVNGKQVHKLESDVDGIEQDVSRIEQHKRGSQVDRAAM